jgi:fructokinase
MSKSSPIVVGLGEVLWDRFPDAERLGGAPANFAFHAFQLGAQSRIASRIGEDAEGRRLGSILRTLGLSTDHLQLDPAHATGSVLVEVSNGQPTYTIASNAAWDYLEMTDDLAGLAASAEAVCFGTLAQRHAVSRATIQGFVLRCPSTALRMFDINLRQSYYDKATIQFGLENARVLKLNSDELERIAEIFHWCPVTEMLVERIFQHFPLKLIALTKGSEGCELWTREQRVISAAPNVRCEDSVGAGDAFSAALVMGLLRGEPLQQIADNANKVGAFVASQPGAFCKLPTELIAP